MALFSLSVLVSHNNDSVTMSQSPQNQDPETEMLELPLLFNHIII